MPEISIIEFDEERIFYHHFGAAQERSRRLHDEKKVHRWMYQGKDLYGWK